MTIIITMAGLGSRFLEAGYSCPKYMIEAKGKTLFEWSLLSLNTFYDESRFVFVSRKEDSAVPFIEKETKKLGIQNIKTIELDQLTDGQATTALLGMAGVPDNEPILIFNIDTFIEPGEITSDCLQYDGAIPCFHAPGEHWSFVKGSKGIAVDVVEKQRISDNCSLGVYYFGSAGLFRSAYKTLYDGPIQGKKEKYIAPMYRVLIDAGYKISFSIVPSEKVHVLGTPQELASFIADN